MLPWPHLENLAKQQHYKTGLDVEPSGQETEGETKNTGQRDLEADITQTGLSSEPNECSQVIVIECIIEHG